MSPAALNLAKLEASRRSVQARVAVDEAAIMYLNGLLAEFPGVTASNKVQRRIRRHARRLSRSRETLATLDDTIVKQRHVVDLETLLKKLSDGS